MFGNITLRARCQTALAALALGAWAGAAQAGHFATLYNFTDGADGAGPNGGVIADTHGTIYGETFTGGGLVCASNHGGTNGCGTIYSFTASGGLKVLTTFNGANGAYGNNGLTLAGSKLYGSAEFGGASDDGVLFSLNTDGSSYTLLHQFSGSDGQRPDGSLVVTLTGVLYGITQYGGTSSPSKGVGVLFSLTPSGLYTVLHSFSGRDGSQPGSLLMASNGVLVGSTLYGGTTSSGCTIGCGTVFTYDPATTTFTTVYALPSSGAEGMTPYVGSIGPGPTIYASQNLDVFSLSEKAGFNVLANLNFYLVGDGTNSGPAYAQSGALYGVVDGGPGGAYGAIYQVLSGSISDLYEFNGQSDGGSPKAKPFIVGTDTLIGTTYGYGKCYECGTIWKYAP